MAYKGTTRMQIKTAAGATRPTWGDLTPLAAEEYTEAAQQVVTRYRVHLPVSAGPIAATDKLVVDGIEYDIKGDPEPHRLRGRLHHSEALVERVTG